MQKNFLLLLLIINVLFIGLVRYNEDNSSELFIKYKPSLTFNFSSDDGQAYKEFVSDHHIDDKGRSLLPLLLIQLMLTSFVLSPIRTDIKRKLFLFAIHFFICFFGFFQLIAIVADQTNKFIAAGLLVVMIVLEFLIIKLFAPKKLIKQKARASLK